MIKEMKIKFSKIIPFKGFFAINLFNTIYVRKEYEDWFKEDASEYKKDFIKKMVNHESIHSAQQKELGYIGFYIAYFFEWLYRLCTEKDAYRKISFEEEAYKYEHDFDYLKNRKHYAQWK